MKIGPTLVEDTFAEAFPMRFVRLVVTAEDAYWLEAAVREATGYAASVIGCDLEAGLDAPLTALESPDGRPGARLLFFGFSTGALEKAVPNRIGQCVMTCPTTAVYDDQPGVEKRIPLGSYLRFFGDGYQKSKVIFERRYWRIPAMDGECVIEATAGVGSGVAGGNFILQSRTSAQMLKAARRAADAIDKIPGAIAPFPGGVVRSGSKVGSKYKGLRASTNEAYCPTLTGRVESRLDPEATCACEIVIDGINREVVAEAMRAGIAAAAGDDVLRISAGNYGGNLGPEHFYLKDLMPVDA